MTVDGRAGLAREAQATALIIVRASLLRHRFATQTPTIAMHAMLGSASTGALWVDLSCDRFSLRQPSPMGATPFRPVAKASPSRPRGERIVLVIHAVRSSARERRSGRRSASLLSVSRSRRRSRSRWAEDAFSHIVNRTCVRRDVLYSSV